MTVEYSICTPVILIIVAFCICFMLRFHNIAVKQAVSFNEKNTSTTKIIRITDAILDLQKGD